MSLSRRRLRRWYSFISFLSLSFLGTARIEDIRQRISMTSDSHALTSSSMAPVELTTTSGCGSESLLE